MSFHLHPDQSALFLDIDGTLLDIASTPGEVVVPPTLRDNLKRLHAKLGGALAFISGRSLENIDMLFAPLRLPASGVHGAEWRLDSAKEERYPLPDSLRADVCRAMARYPKLIVEDKKYAMAIHYRQAPEMADMLEDMLRKMLLGAEQYLSLMRGKMVLEIVYPGQHKGAAIERFMQHRPFAGRHPFFLGDDETDVFAIKACLKMGGSAECIGQSGAAFATPGDVRAWIGQQA